LRKLQCGPLSQDVQNHGAIYRREKDPQKIEFVISGHIITYRIMLHFHSEYGLFLTQNITFSWDYLGKKT
jgi:hypothetical protein